MTDPAERLTPLHKAIVRTLAYFDVFDYPLTLVQCRKWLIADKEDLDRPTMSNVLDALTSAPLTDLVREKDGFYFLGDREAIMEERLQRALWADRKYARARRVIRLLTFLPFIRMIAVVNTLAISHSRDASDIDLFIVTTAKRVWTARFWSAVALKLLRLRPEEARRDGVCLSFFIDERHLDIEHLRLSESDMYLAYWVDQIVPAYDPGNHAAAFRNANQWIMRSLPMSYGVQPIRARRVTETFMSWLIRGAIEIVHAWKLGAALERLYRRIQLHMLPETLQTMANNDSRVVVSDTLLKFHTNDRREQFARSWIERVTRVFEDIGL